MVVWKVHAESGDENLDVGEMTAKLVNLGLSNVFIEEVEESESTGDTVEADDDVESEDAAARRATAAEDDEEED